MNDDLLPVCRVGELDQPKEQPRWLVQDLWGHAAVGFAGGFPKLGKTWLGLDLALSVATATPCLDRFEVHEPGDALVYLAEDHPTEVRQRLAGLCQHRDLAIERVAVHVITAPSLRLDLERDQRRLAETVHCIQPRLLVLDPLVRLHRRDENQAQDVAQLLGFLRELQRTHDLAILVVHHMRKGGAGRGGQALRGSGDLHAFLDSGLYLRTERDRLVLHAEHRSAPAPDPIELRLVSRPDGSQTHLEIVATQNPHPRAPQPPLPLDERLVRLLQSASTPLPRMELRQTLRVNNQRLGQALVDLERRDIVTRCQHGWRLTSPNASNGTHGS